MTATTWPTQPLVDATRRPQRDICAALGVNGHTWRRLEQTGLSDWQADRAAVRLGTVPHLVWPDWIDAGLGPLDHDYLRTGWRQAWLYQEAAA